MDESALERCMALLREADQLMVAGIDDWHRARLAHVIGMLEQAYPRQQPAPPTLRIV
jgi:hypothetical protein